MTDACDSGHCMTCSDEGREMRVLRPGRNGLALCAGDDGAEVEVMTELVGPVTSGDEILVHAGVAIARVT